MCKEEYEREFVISNYGPNSTRAFYCHSCRELILREQEEYRRNREINIARNLWAAYRGWWKHYTTPRGWAALLRTESENCPYCGCFLTDEHPPRIASTAVIDHMDPLSLGGEDSLRNAVYCCNHCNGKKKNKLFTRWLDELQEPFKKHSRTLYVFKHEHKPEEFEAGSFQIRVEGVLNFLLFDEKQFNKEFKGMLPVANEPPRWYLLELLRPHKGPINVEIMIYRDATTSNEK